MSFRHKPQTADEKIAQLEEDIRSLQARLSGVGLGGGSLILGAVVVDGTVAGVELVDDDGVTSLGTAATTMTPSPTIGRAPVLDATGAVVGWVAVYDV